MSRNEKKIITAGELALIFEIREETLKKIAKSEDWPCLYQKKRLCFDFTQILNRLKQMEGKAV